MTAPLTQPSASPATPPAPDPPDQQQWLQATCKVVVHYVPQVVRDQAQCEGLYTNLLSNMVWVLPSILFTLAILLAGLVRRRRQSLKTDTPSGALPPETLARVLDAKVRPSPGGSVVSRYATTRGLRGGDAADAASTASRTIDSGTEANAPRHPRLLHDLRDLLIRLPRWNEQACRQSFAEQALGDGNRVLAQMTWGGSAADVAWELAKTCQAFNNNPVAHRPGLSLLCALLAEAREQFDGHAECDARIADLAHRLGCPGHEPNPAASGLPTYPRAVAAWRKKLEFLLEQEALTSNPAQRFELAEQIDECHAKLRQLGVEQ